MVLSASDLYDMHKVPNSTDRFTCYCPPNNRSASVRTRSAFHSRGWYINIQNRLRSVNRSFIYKFYETRGSTCRTKTRRRLRLFDNCYLRRRVKRCR